MKKRIAIKTETFKVPGTFESYYTAKGWCIENGYSFGSMARQMPIALYKGDFNISKWYNLSKTEQETCDGVMLSSDFREGEVTIIIYK